MHLHWFEQIKSFFPMSAFWRKYDSTNYHPRPPRPFLIDIKHAVTSISNMTWFLYLFNPIYSVLSQTDCFFPVPSFKRDSENPALCSRYSHTCFILTTLLSLHSLDHFLKYYSSSNLRYFSSLQGLHTSCYFSWIFFSSVFAGMVPSHFSDLISNVTSSGRLPTKLQNNHPHQYSLAC